MNNNPPAWTIDSPNAVSETIDGELVVMNLATGNYFSGQGVGALLWSCFERQWAPEDAMAAVLAVYDVDAERLKADYQRFVDSLREHGLIRPAEAAAAAQPAIPSPARMPYATPELILYSDMKDLLMLDPIHDVADEGWPTRPADPDFR